MIALMWNVSVAIRRYLRMYMPTNIAIDLLRSRGGLKWAMPAALVAVPAYLFAAAMSSSAVNRGGPGWFNIVVLLCLWNAMKLAAMAAWSSPLLVRVRRRQDDKPSGPTWPLATKASTRAIRLTSDSDGRFAGSS